MEGQPSDRHRPPRTRGGAGKKWPSKPLKPLWSERPSLPLFPLAARAARFAAGRSAGLTLPPDSCSLFELKFVMRPMLAGRKHGVND